MIRTDAIGWRFTLVLPLWLALFGLVSHLLLIAGVGIPVVLFPACLVVAAAVALRITVAPEPTRPDEPGPRWLPWVCVALLAAAVGAVGYGALATGPRIWDGFVSWSLRADLYAPGNEQLARLSTSRPGFFVHSRSYPLLQPLCVGASRALLGARAGNLFLPLVFVDLIALVGQSGRRLGMPKSHAWVLAACFGTTPMWLSTGSGGVDSGYAELLLGYALCLFASGVVLRSLLMVTTAALLLPWIKPEALVYGTVLCTTLPFVADRRLHLAATAGFAAGLIAWLPLADQLLDPTGSGSSAYLLAAIASSTFVVVQGAVSEWHRRSHPNTRAIVLVAVTLLVVTVVVASFVLHDLAAHGHPLAVALVGLPSSLPERLAKIPQLILGYLQGFTFVRKYGLVYILAIALLVLRRRLTRPPDPALLVFLGTGIVLTCLAMFVVPPENLAHEFESRYDRLLLQWTAVAWLMVGPWVSALLHPGPNAEPIWANRPPAA